MDNFCRVGFLMPLHPLTNLEIQKYYQSDCKFKGIYSWKYLPKIKDGVYIINPDFCKWSSNILW